MEASCQVKPADQIAVQTDTQLNVSTGYPKTPQAIDPTARRLARRLISRAGAATG